MTNEAGGAPDGRGSFHSSRSTAPPVRSRPHRRISTRPSGRGRGRTPRPVARLLGCRAHRGVEPADVGVEAARAFEVGAVHVDVEDPGVVHPKAHCNDGFKICEAEDVLPDGIVVVVKRSCPTCQLVARVLDQLERDAAPLTVYAQDDTDFPAGRASTTPSWRSPSRSTSTRCRRCCASRAARWSAAPKWLATRPLGGDHGRSIHLGTDLPDWRPGCGSRTHDPDVQDALTIARTRTVDAGTPHRARLRPRTRSRRCTHAGGATGCPSCHPRSNASRACWPRRPRDPQDLVAVVPPDLVDCTVEKVAINAVMAGCRPEYLPVVLDRGRGRVHRRVQHPRRARDDVVLGPARDRQRADHARDRDEQRRERARSGQPGERDHRPRAAARGAQRRWRTAGRGRPGHARHAGEVHVLLRRGRSRVAVGAAARRTRPARRPRRRSRCSRPKVCAASSISCRGHRNRSPARSRRACERWRTRRTSSSGTRFSSSRPSTLACSARPGGRRLRLRKELGALLQIPGEEIVRGAGGIAEGMPEGFRDIDPAEVPRRRAPDRARGWRRGLVLRDHRRVGERRGRQRAGDEGGTVREHRCSTRPSERRPATRERVPRPDSLDGKVVGLLDISKPRGDVFLDRIEELPPRARHRRASASPSRRSRSRARRSAPRDLDQVRRGDRSTRRLRIVHVVQCARHREHRSRRDPDGVRRVDRVRRRR